MIFFQDYAIFMVFNSLLKIWIFYLMRIVILKSISHHLNIYSFSDPVFMVCWFYLFLSMLSWSSHLPVYLFFIVCHCIGEIVCKKFKAYDGIFLQRRLYLILPKCLGEVAVWIFSNCFSWGHTNDWKLDYSLCKNYITSDSLHSL